jgi:hypothetical protein
MFDYLIVVVWLLNAASKDIFGHILVYPKSNQLNDAVFHYSFINLRYIPPIPLQ